MMACESEECCVTSTNPIIISSPSTPTKQPSTPQTPPASSSRPNNTCFSCKRSGHWFRDCPNKTAKKSQPSSPGSTSPSSIGFLLIRCPCGQGICVVWSSTTQRNPGRKFYGCPGGRGSGCGFFKWCDEFPIKTCPCGAGICSLNRDSSGRWYYSCRIKKNHGACQFFQWVDSHAKMVMNDNFGKEKGLCSERELNSQVVESSRNPQDISIMIVDSKTDAVNDKVLAMKEARDLGMHQAASWDPLMGKVCRVSHPIPQSEISCQLAKFSWKISIEGIFPSFDPITILDNVEMSYIEGSNLPLQNPSYAKPETSLATKAEDDQPLSAIRWEPSGLKSPYTVETNDLSMSVFKKFGQALLDILQSMNPSNHEKMLELAEATFYTFRGFSIDYGPFSEGVKDYIQCASSLAKFEQSMRKDASTEELIDLYNCEKVHFDNVSLLHAELVASYEASNNHLELLQEEVLQVQDKLVQLEKQLSLYEAKTLELQTRVFEVSNERSESEKNMEAASQEMEKALDLEQQKEMIVDAAKAALESARFHLQE